MSSTDQGAEYLSRRHPHLFHMTDERGLESIGRHGLLSTSALLDLFGITSDERIEAESEWRANAIQLSDVSLGTAVIRDQKPMRPAALTRCLQDGLTPSDWYLMLNRKVFFWPTEQRVTDLLKARAYRDRSHIVLRIDTASLLADSHLRVWATLINTGSAIYNPAPRGPASFVPMTEAHKMKRIAEIAVDDAIPDIRRHLISVDRRRAPRA